MVMVLPSLVLDLTPSLIYNLQRPKFLMNTRQPRLERSFEKLEGELKKLLPLLLLHSQRNTIQGKATKLLFFFKLRLSAT